MTASSVTSVEIWKGDGASKDTVVVDIKYGSHSSVMTAYDGRNWGSYENILHTLQKIKGLQDYSNVDVAVGAMHCTLARAVELAMVAIRKAIAPSTVGKDEVCMRTLLYAADPVSAEPIRCACGRPLTIENSWPNQCACRTRMPTTVTGVQVMMRDSYEAGLAEGRAENVTTTAAEEEAAAKKERIRWNSDRELIERLDKILRNLSKIRNDYNDKLDTESAT